jgi:anaerobic selenocysteine-containing dehydrogenase
MQQIPGLEHKSRRCTLRMNGDDALQEGLQNDDLVEVSTAVGKARVKVEVTNDIARGVVNLPHGWSDIETAAAPDEGMYGVNINRITDFGGMDPLTGTARLNGVPVQVRRIHL